MRPLQSNRSLTMKRRLHALLRIVLIVSLISILLAEAAVRMLVVTGSDGMLKIGRIHLVPYRPDREHVLEHLQKISESTYVVFHSRIGWSIKPNGVAGNGDFQYQSNSQGVRSDPGRFFSRAPPLGSVRIVTVGDSFTHGDDVNNNETWQHYLELLRTDLEVLNLGIPGAGTDQAFLRWQEDGKPFNPQIVILGIWPENIARNLNLIRYYLAPSSSAFVSKPRMLIENGASKMINSPIMNHDDLLEALTEPDEVPLMKNEYWYDPAETDTKLYHNSMLLRTIESIYSYFHRIQIREQLYAGVRPEGIDITVAIAERFSKDVHRMGAIPVVVVIPMRHLLDLHLSDETFPLVKSLKNRGVNVIDLGPSFGNSVKEKGFKNMYTSTNHHTPLANQLLAEFLEIELRPWIEKAKKLQ